MTNAISHVVVSYKVFRNENMQPWKMFAIEPFLCYLRGGSAYQVSDMRLRSHHNGPANMLQTMEIGRKFPIYTSVRNLLISLSMIHICAKFVDSKYGTYLWGMCQLKS